MTTTNDPIPGSGPPNILGPLTMAVGTSLVQIAVATLVGYWIDSLLGWMLWTPIGVCLGMALGMKTLLTFLRKIPTPSGNFKKFDEDTGFRGSEPSDQSQ
ncbi:MAG: hypothetical protein ACOVNQ_16495 [Pirellula sp.]